jgi:hypothetical protein
MLLNNKNMEKCSRKEIYFYSKNTKKMTNEKKLKILLQVAVENGWKDKHDLLNQFESIVDNISLYVDDAVSYTHLTLPTNGW